jgi:hypothetical protein
MIASDAYPSWWNLTKTLYWKLDSCQGKCHSAPCLPRWPLHRSTAFPAVFDWPCRTAYNELYLAASVRPLHDKPASTLGCGHHAGDFLA